MAATATTAKKFQDTKLAGWLLENSFVWMITYIRTRFIPLPHIIPEKDEDGNKLSLAAKLKIIMRNIIICYATSVASEIGAVYSLKIVDTLLYSHVPHFTKQTRSHSPFTWNAFRDWVGGILMLDFLLLLILASRDRPGGA